MKNPRYFMVRPYGLIFESGKLVGAESPEHAVTIIARQQSARNAHWMVTEIILVCDYNYRTQQEVQVTATEVERVVDGIITTADRK